MGAGKGLFGVMGSEGSKGRLVGLCYQLGVPNKVAGQRAIPPADLLKLHMRELPARLLLTASGSVYYFTSTFIR